MMTGTLGYRWASARNRQRIAEPHVEGGLQSELLPDADRQHPAMHEHGGIMRDRRLEHCRNRIVLQPVAVHRGEEGDATHLLLAQRVGEPRRGIWRQRIEHEESDEARRILRHRRGDRGLVAGNAGDEHASRDRMSIELRDPAIRERFGSSRRFPPETGGNGVSAACLPESRSNPSSGFPGSARRRSGSGRRRVSRGDSSSSVPETVRQVIQQGQRSCIAALIRRTCSPSRGR